MKRIKNKFFGGSKGQAMAEFALTIPVFLLLVFGIIELSRFFLVYSSVFTAVREATRYGSSVGDAAIPNYQNCEMIAETAVRMGNFGGVQPNDVIVYFESEPGTWVADCDPDDDPEDRYQPVLGDRVVVEIDTNYDSLLGVVPDLTVSAENGRTIMLGVQSQVAVINTVNTGGSSTATSAATATTTSVTPPTNTPSPTSTTAGQTPTATLTRINTPSTSPITPTVQCPTGNIVITGNTNVNSGQKTITIYLKNETGEEYKLDYFDNIQWNRYYQQNQNQTYDRRLIELKFRSNNLISISYEPPTGKIYPGQIDSLVNVSEINIPVMVKFSERIDNIGLSFKINFTKPDGTCQKTLNYPGN